jgi:hypothetical protein
MNVNQSRVPDVANVEQDGPYNNLNDIPYWHPDYKESNFVKVSDFLASNCVNPLFDLFRTSIPSNEEMLIKNLPGIKGKIVLIDKLKQLDIDEESILQTNKEKWIDSLRLDHFAANVLGTCAGLATSALGIIGGAISEAAGGSFGSKIIALTSCSAGIAVGLFSHRFVNQDETARKYILIRLIRLDAKIDCIDSILVNYNTSNLSSKKQNEKLQLEVARLGLERIIGRCMRIYKNSVNYCDTTTHSPQGGRKFDHCIPTYNSTTHYRNVRDSIPHRWVQEKVTEYTYAGQEKIIDINVPPNDIEKELYQDVKKLEKKNRLL